MEGKQDFTQTCITPQEDFPRTVKLYSPLRQQLRHQAQQRAFEQIRRLVKLKHMLDVLPSLEDISSASTAIFLRTRFQMFAGKPAY